MRRRYKVDVYKLSKKATINIIADTRKEAREITTKFINDLTYTKKLDYNHVMVIERKRRK